MNFKNYITIAVASALLFTMSCRNDDPVTEVPKGDYQNGILIANEGNFGKPNATISWVSPDYSTVKDDVYKTVNGENLGDVLISVAFKGDDAYLAVNNSNKIVVANRYTLKKTSEITAEVHQPRYVAFSNNKLFVTNNDFFSTRKLNIYDGNNAFVKSISFDRYAEKVVEAGNYIYVQTDGSQYLAPNYEESATGHTVTRVNATTNAVDKTITLNDTGIIKDMISYNGTVYVLSADKTATTLFKINGATGEYQPVKLDVPNGNKVVAENNQLYILGSKKVYYMPTTASSVAGSFSLDSAASPYGFNVIDGKVYVSYSDFVSNSKVSVYDTKGTVLKTFTAGMGTNGFYKN